MLAHPAFPPPPAPGEKPVSADDWYQQTLNRQISLTREQVGRVVQMAEAIHSATDHSGPLTTDGSDWIFEIEEARHYQVVDFRSTPPAVAKRLGLFLVEDLGQVKMDRSGIY